MTKDKKSLRAGALFDLDGVLFDTETQYSAFWGKVGSMYHPEERHFEQMIKGQTLEQILDRWFAGRDEARRKVVAELADFERRMSYHYVPGAERFLQALQAADIPSVVVTSSNIDKMRNVYRMHPEFGGYFRRVLTAECFSRSKPAPDCYLLGARTCGLSMSRCVVFEDSFNGLKAGQAAGARVVGLSTTNASEHIRYLCDEVIPDFQGFGVEKMLGMLVQTDNND